MKITKIIIFVSLFISLLNAQEENLLLYPLHVGDYWQYKMVYDSSVFDYDDTTYYVYKKITDKVLSSDNKMYYKFEEGNVGSSFGYNYYVRIDSTNNTVYRKDDILDNNESLTDSLDSKEGDSFDFNLYTQCTNVDTIEYFGKLVKRKTFYVPIIDVEQEYYLAEGFGEIYRYSYEPYVVAADRKFYLTYAVINGIEYGNPATSVKEEIPTDYKLKLDNYPNPFNNETIINFSIRQESKISIKVFNLLGELKTEIFNGTKTTGNYKINFNASDLSSGTYILLLKTKDDFIARKILLLK